MFHIIHNQFIVKIDFIVQKDFEYRLQEFKRRRPVKLEEVDVWFVSAEDLILSKLAWAKNAQSQMQMNDVS